VSVKRACRLALLRRATWYKRHQAKDQTALRRRIRDLANARPRFGYLRIQVLLRREGWMVNHGASPLSARRPAGAYARTPPQAPQPASGAGAHA